MDLLEIICLLIVIILYCIIWIETGNRPVIFLSLHRAFWYSHSSFTNSCTFIRTLITICIKIRWLLHVSVYDHHQACILCAAPCTAHNKHAILGHAATPPHNKSRPNLNEGFNINTTLDRLNYKIPDDGRRPKHVGAI